MNFKSQRGLGWPEVLIVLAIAAAVAIALGYTYMRGEKAGHADEKTAWQARELEQQRTYAAALERLRREKDEALAKLQVSLADAEKAYQAKQEEAKRAKAENDRIARDLRDGKLVLRDPGAAPGDAARGLGSTCPPAPGGGNGQAQGGGRLSPILADFLWAEAARADALVGDLEEQLTLTQDVVTAYYEIAKSCARK